MKSTPPFQKAEIFQVWSHLTILNMPQLERQDEDIQSKVEELEDDMISQLSAQLVALSTSLQGIKRRQQLM